MPTNLPHSPEVQAPVIGSDRDTWGQLLLNVVAMFDRFGGSQTALDVTAGHVFLSVEQAQCLRFAAFGSPTSTRDFNLRRQRYGTYVLANHCATNEIVRFKVEGDDAGLHIPRGTRCVAFSDGANLVAASPPVYADGSFPGTYNIAGRTVPGIRFDNDTYMGISKPEVGVIGITVDGDGIGGDSVRVHENEDPGRPTLAFGHPARGYSTGFLQTDWNAIAACAAGRRAVYIKEGVMIGEPTGGMPGYGTLNVQNGIKFDNYDFAPKQIGPVGLVDNGSMQARHGYGRQPRYCECWLECVIAQGGYGVGDRVKPNRCWGNDVPCTVWSDGTNCGLVGGGSGWEIRDKGTRAGFKATAGSWQVIWNVA